MSAASLRSLATSCLCCLCCVVLMSLYTGCGAVFPAMRQHKADPAVGARTVDSHSPHSAPASSANSAGSMNGLRLPVLILLGVALRCGVLWLGMDALTERVEWSVGRTRLKQCHPISQPRTPSLSRHAPPSSRHYHCNTTSAALISRTHSHLRLICVVQYVSAPTGRVRWMTGPLTLSLLPLPPPLPPSRRLQRLSTALLFFYSCRCLSLPLLLSCLCRRPSVG